MEFIGVDKRFAARCQSGEVLAAREIISASPKVKWFQSAGQLLPVNGGFVMH